MCFIRGSYSCWDRSMQDILAAEYLLCPLFGRIRKSDLTACCVVCTQCTKMLSSETSAGSCPQMER